jgi:RNA 3'-terminal phosphate cyclase
VRVVGLLIVVTYRGGTSVLAALQVAYCGAVFKPTVQRMGVEFDVNVDQRYHHRSLSLSLSFFSSRL